MDWKDRLKWKILIILFAVAGIIIIWIFAQAGDKSTSYYDRKLREKAIHENERASAAAAEKETDAPKEIPEESAGHPVETETVSSDSEPAISVLLMTDDYKSYTHEEVIFQFQGEYFLNGKEEKVFKNGEKLVLSHDSDLFTDGRLEIEPAGRDNRAVLQSLNRQQGCPAYRGRFTVYQEEGGMRIVNTLPLEEYLYGVVPSEMPATYGQEALKAQAVCARTYACVQMKNSSLEELGAQVDDSVSYQVYQNVSEAESSSRAVDETKGEILTCDGEPITAYYFSTSSGKTSTDLVWEVSAPSSYLKSVACEYDASEPWHSWKVTFSADRLLEQAKKKFPEINELYAVRTAEENTESVLQLILESDAGEKILSDEYEIRELLSPEGAVITRQDGSEVKGGMLLPSAYFTLEEIKDGQGKLSGYIVHGGGYGHGVGLSQNGAKGMAEQGMVYEDILEYFYKDVKLTDISDVL